MLSVDKYARIRQAHRDGMSIRAIARTFHHSRRKVREVLANPEPKPFAQPEPTACKLGKFVDGFAEGLKAPFEHILAGFMGPRPPVRFLCGFGRYKITYFAPSF